MKIYISIENPDGKVVFTAVSPDINSAIAELGTFDRKTEPEVEDLPF